MIITLNDKDLLRVQVIDMDDDAQEALAFIRERIIPALRQQQGMKMQGHLDGGKGSIL
ncbi:MAG: hypothetical protein ACYDBB_02050 [Armatimonadota bacterium]